MTIHVIGTAHTDLEGSSRLERALAIENPDILTVEDSELSIDRRRTRAPRDAETALQILRGKGLSQRVYDVLARSVEVFASAYETTVCEAYAQRTGTPIHLIDDGEWMEKVVYNDTRKRLERLRKMPLPVLRAIAEMFTPKGVSLLYGPFDEAFSGAEDPSVVEEFYINPVRGTTIGKRDHTMAKRLLRITGDNPQAKIVHVGGADHCLDDRSRETLYTRLQMFGLNPSRRTLGSYSVR